MRVLIRGIGLPHPVQRIIDLAIAALLGGALFAIGKHAIHDPLGLALWSAIACVCILPVAFVPAITSRRDVKEHLCHGRYAFAALPLIVGVGVIVGWTASFLIAAVALSLIGGASLVVAIRIPPSYAIAMTIFGATLAFTWPVWASGLLEHHDFEPWLQRAVDVSPAFAINSVVSPEDALTHRPTAYRLMNLGQDVSYAMPATIWPCIALHAGLGLLGLLANVALRSQPPASMPAVE